jgi:hypothetical protein
MEDADQNIDRDENPKPGEKDHNISSNPLICATARGGDLPRHLSSPPVWTLEVVRMGDRLRSVPRAIFVRQRHEAVNLVAYGARQPSGAGCRAGH